jgi:hypothetical protein
MAKNFANWQNDITEEDEKRGFSLWDEAFRNGYEAGQTDVYGLLVEKLRLLPDDFRKGFEALLEHISFLDASDKQKVESFDLEIKSANPGAESDTYPFFFWCKRWKDIEP